MSALSFSYYWHEVNVPALRVQLDGKSMVLLAPSPSHPFPWPCAGWWSTNDWCIKTNTNLMTLHNYTIPPSISLLLSITQISSQLIYKSPKIHFLSKKQFTLETVEGIQVFHENLQLMCFTDTTIRNMLEIPHTNTTLENTHFKIQN